MSANDFHDGEGRFRLGGLNHASNLAKNDVQLGNAIAARVGLY